MTNLIVFSEIVEENSKTIRENNMERQHNIPLGALVELKHTEWHGDGACERIHARLWVVNRGRDCDGTPLYSLAPKPLEKQNDVASIHFKDEESEWTASADVSRRMFYNWRTGYPEESLTVVEVTDKLKEGYDTLTWDDEEEDTVILSQRADDYHACIDGESGKWGCGPSPEAAVNDLRKTWPESEGLSVQFVI